MLVKGIEIDAESIESIRELGGSGENSLLKELIILYQTETPKLIDLINLGLTNSNFEFIAIYSHSLKSSSANLGLVEVRTLAGQIEKMVLDDKNFDVKKIIVILNKIKDILPKVYDALESLEGSLKQ